jgi:hypothetical protein
MSEQRSAPAPPAPADPEARLLGPAEPGRFDPAELAELAAPVRRHLAQAIAPGTALATSARLTMRGQIKVGRWLPFRARQVLDPHRGFVWTARAAGLIAGVDRYLDDAGRIVSLQCDRWEQGEFFRYRITGLEPAGPAAEPR